MTKLGEAAERAVRGEARRGDDLARAQARQEAAERILPWFLSECRPLDPVPVGLDGHFEEASRQAVRCADILLAELERTAKP